MTDQEEWGQSQGRTLRRKQNSEILTSTSKPIISKCKSVGCHGCTSSDHNFEDNIKRSSVHRKITSEEEVQQSTKMNYLESDFTPEYEEMDSFSLYSSGYMTRGQINRIKQMFGESSNICINNNNFEKKSTKYQSQDTELVVSQNSSALELSGHSAKTDATRSLKAMMKRKHDDILHHSPEKKACKWATGSVVTARTAVLPTVSNAELNSVARIDSFLNETLGLPSQDNCASEASFSDAISTLTAPSTPTENTSAPEGTDAWLQRFLHWSARGRMQVLNSLIGVCQPHEVRYMLEVIQPRFQRDFISLLPKELGLHVLSFLEPCDLLVAAQTCKNWRILAEDNLMWREKCIEEGIVEPYMSNYTKTSMKHRNIFALGNSGWKAAFLRQIRIENNWRNGNQKISKILRGHDDHVITCLQFNGSRIVSGSDDNTLKVWSVLSGKCLRTLSGHTGGVWTSQMRKNLIISGSTDRTLRIWNADTGECVHTLYGHTSTVRCLALHDNIVVSGSRDATLRVWNIDTGACLHILSGHMAAVRCVCYDGRRVVSGAYDFMVKVWNPQTEECLHTLQGHTNRVYSLQFDGNYAVSGSLDTSIRVWDVERGTCLHTLMGHQSLTSGMELKNNILVSGNADSTVKIWDILTGKCLKTLEGSNKHLSAVTCLQFHGKFVITSSDDGTVKLWDIKTGKIIRDLVALESRGSGGVVWRIKASQTKLVCAVGSRNGTEETKLLVLDFADKGADDHNC